MPAPDDAVPLLQSGRLAEADALLDRCLADNPADARALSLRGTLGLLAGRPADAQTALEAARVLAPDDVRVLVNLGSALLALGRTREARTHLEHAALVAPDDHDPPFNLALVADAEGRLRDALEHYREALTRGAAIVDVGVNQATTLMRLGDFAASLEALGPVLEQDPEHGPARLLALGIHVECADLRAAEALIEQLLPTFAADARFLALQGAARYRAGRLDEAVEHYRAALEAGDTRRSTALELAESLFDSGRAGEAVDVLADLGRAHPGDAEVAVRLGRALREAGDFHCAATAFEQAAGLMPGGAPAVDAMRAGVLRSLGDTNGAAALMDDAIARAPHLAGPRMARIEARMATADFAGALTDCEQHLAQRPRDFTVLAAHGFALHAAGQTEAAARLLDHDRLVRAEPLVCPDGFDHLGAFNAALAAHVRAHPSLSHAGAAGRATQHGRQSGNLFFGEVGPFAAFRDAIWQAARRFMADLPNDPSHPWLAVCPELTGVHCWGVVLESSGHQSSHIHPTGWLSGVYYPALPAAIGEADDPSGWLEFAAPPPELAHGSMPEPLRIRPREGLLVLFPSFFYHRTVPFESDEERISVAFDFQARGHGA